VAAVRRIAFACIILSLLTAAALADKIVLKDGRVLEGEIISATADSVTIKLKLGEATFSRDQIKSIEYGPVEKPEQPEEEHKPKPSPPPRDEKQTLILIRRYLREKDESARKKLAEALQPAFEANPEMVEKAAAGFRKYSKRRTGHSQGDLEVNGVKTKYALYVPKKYTTKKAWPLLVALHGGSGNGPSYVRLWHFPVKGKLPKEQVIKYQQAEVRGYIVVAPSARKEWRWGPGKEAQQHIFAVINRVRDLYNVDPNRIYIHGLSMGGHGTWLFGLHFADRFAAIEPRAAGCNLRFLVNAKNLPVYITHGAKDEAVPVKYSRDAAAALKKFDYDHHYSEIAEGGHQFFIDENKKVLDFFDKRKRVPCPRDVVWLADSPRHGRAYWLEINKFKAGGLAKVEGSYAPKTNTIEIKTENVAKLTIYLNRKMVDFAKPVIVKVNGEEKHNAVVKLSAGTFLEILRTTRDEARLFSAKLMIDVK
jgi:poly(3-hydroxybutyrate) depolymerase